MKRKSDSAVHSFEMFLDIICNAFGGIIFIALLLCIMLQVSGGALTASQEIQAKQFKDNSEEIQRLSQLLEIQQHQLKSLRNNSDDEKLTKYLELQELLKQKQEQLQKAREMAEIANDKSSKLDELIAAEKQTNEKLQQQLSEITDQKADLRLANVTLSVPRQQKTSLTPVNMLLRNGKLVLLNRYNSAGQLIGRNTRQIELISKNGVTLARPKYNTGEFIPAASKDHGGETREKFITSTIDAIRPMLRKFQPRPQAPSQKYYMNIAVWADSFEQFETLRDALIKMGFEYNFVPVEQDKSIPIKTQGQKVVQ